ncbi:MAG: hypothetical protein INQ03_22920 [Candidatus Heimdallarchaeota archaeon]|nr:hypothetical protein [Candidatus Heimdallarchaeota archaeon]
MRISSINNIKLGIITVVILFSVLGTVTANEDDQIPPTLIELTVSKSDVNVGDIIEISVDAYDAHGLRTVYVIFTAPEVHILEYEMLYNGTLWVYNFEITANLHDGVYEISTRLVDSLNNQATVYPAGKYFNIIGTTVVDNQAPVFNSYGVNASTASAGDTVRYYADVSDSSEIKQVLLVVYIGCGECSGDVWYELEMMYNSSLNIYYADFLVDYRQQPDEISIDFFYAEDYYGNYVRMDAWQMEPIRYLPDNGNYRLEVILNTDIENWDDAPPVWNQGRTYFSSNAVPTNGTASLHLTVVDSLSEVKSVQVYITRSILESQPIFILNLVYNATSGYWEGSFPVNDGWEGWYVVERVIAYDEINNWFEQRNAGDGDHPRFCVYDPDEDTYEHGVPDDWIACHGYGLASFDPWEEVDGVDGDGLVPYEEFILGTYPRIRDTDGDGLDDGWEHMFLEGILSPTKGDSDDDWIMDGDEDSDGDGLSNEYEETHGLWPNNTDTDGDCMSDGFEVTWASILGIDPLVPNSGSLDYDSDGLSNKDEDKYGTFPNIADTDEDAIDDYDEIFIHGTNPLEHDSDFDTLGDYSELFFEGTDPLNNDTDGDGLGDAFEVSFTQAFTDPQGNLAEGMVSALKFDTDEDGLSDYIEIMISGTYPFMRDSDYDNVTDYLEFKVFHTAPMANDTDSDTLSDFFELYISKTNATSADTDEDGLSDAFEMNETHTDPNKADTDEDGLSDYMEIYASNSSPFLKDTDLDGLDDYKEYFFGSSSHSNDSDGDLLPDLWEYTYGFLPTLNETYLDADNDTLNNLMEYYNVTHPGYADYDNDTLIDYYELLNSTDPWFWDSDLDGLSDGEEVLIYQTIPLWFDSDGDTLDDYAEIMVIGSNPRLFDSDNDSLSDGQEYNIYHTDWGSNDTDNDSIADNFEIFYYKTDPLDNDTDDDLGLDYIELFDWKTDPLNNDTDADGIIDGLETITDPLNPDTDSDRVLDGEELEYGSDPLLNDTDGDKLSDWLEIFEYESNPASNDTDNDKMPDGWEAFYGLELKVNDTMQDPDDDGLANYAEFLLGTDPTNPDTDGDTWGDGREFNDGTDPLDPDSHPEGEGIIDGIMAQPALSAGALLALVLAMFTGAKGFGGKP